MNNFPILPALKKLSLLLSLFTFFSSAHAAPPSIQTLRQGTWPGFKRGFLTDVEVVGKYAYVTVAFGGLEVIDVSNPTDCTRVGGYGPVEIAMSVAIAGNYAYLADGYSGLKIIDVSNPADCKRVGGYNTEGNAVDVAVSGNFAYVADSQGGLVVIDVSDPSRCVKVRDYTEPRYLPEHVETFGGHVYVTGSGLGGLFLQVFDINDLTNPGRASLAGVGMPSPVTVSGNHAFVATRESGLQVIDIRNPTAPMNIGQYLSGDANDVAAVGSYVYVADGTGLHVVDVRNPSNPVRAGGLATDFGVNFGAIALLTTNVTTMPFDFVDFDVKTADKPRKFYRVRQP